MLQALCSRRQSTSSHISSGSLPSLIFYFGSLDFLPPPASAAPFVVTQQLPIPSRRGDPAAPEKANQGTSRPAEICGGRRTWVGRAAEERTPRARLVCAL